jgi:hypothetical protein
MEQPTSGGSSRFFIGQHLMNKDGELEGLIIDITYEHMPDHSGGTCKVPVVHLAHPKHAAVATVAIREDYLSGYVGVDPDGVISGA